MKAAPIAAALALTLTLTLTCAAPARAEPPPAAPAPAPVATPPPAFVAPRLESNEAVPYPPEAHGEDASVLLELLVDAEGHVVRAVVIDGAEPFASAARSAAEHWKYVPARRGDTPARARIRARVDFHPASAPEAAPESAPSAGAPRDKAPAPAPARGVVEEVTVQGAREELAKTSLGTSEIRQLPGAFGDAFRAVEIMPGVTPIVSGLPYFYVRGAPPGNTGYFIDGVRVPLLFHFGIVQSVIHPALLDHVDFYAGGYPSRFGRFTGGILSGETTPPATRLHGEYNARLVDAGALVEAPLFSGKADVLAAGRYGYPGLLLRVFAPEARLEYWDYQTRVGYTIDDRNRLELFTFGSHDFIGSVNKQTGKLESATTIGFHRADLRFDHQLTPDTHLRLATTFGVDETSTESGGVRDLLAAVRAQWESRISSRLTLRGGADANFDYYDVSGADTSSPNTGGNSTDPTRFPTRGEVANGLWLDAIWKVTSRYELVPGLRADYFANNGSPLGVSGGAKRGAGAWSLDPRLASRLRLSSKLSYLATIALAHQPPSFPATIPGFQPGQLRSGLQTAVQFSQGVEVALPAEFTLSPTLFVHNYLAMTDGITSCRFLSGGDAPNDCLDQRVRGRAFGAEVMLKRSLTKRLTGLVTYTLSRSTRDAHGPFGAGFTSDIPSEFDRTHVLNVIGAYDLGRRWRAGARLFLYSGRPYSNQFDGVDVPPYNVNRFPLFYRLDLRLEKQWAVGERGRISFVIEWLNAFMSKEAITLQCERGAGDPIGIGGARYDRCQPNEIGPITVPSIGVEGAF